ncbi:hypothetical protein [Clostridium botulinum]|uniref:hypothetical protein n=1 Tax=Clostridium botulinum TaxID=1491 RepID=UPI000AC35467|nr:hypothetical protein [Clostridium botulinum]
MPKLADENTIKSLKKFRESLDRLITLYEKDESEITEEELENATGKFMIACMGLNI